MITQLELESAAELLTQALVKALSKLGTGNGVSAIGEFVLELRETQIDLPESCREKIWAAFHEAAARNRLESSGIYQKVREALGVRTKERGALM